uniref:Putative low density lipoprotein receptor adapter protein 1-b-like isoform x1 n=1 Tax=Xenopsylla cheopis TaxID=163159 RepID=A0A6M2DFJ0_XENCH
MSFFKNIWKSNSKHHKLCEEWALANSLKENGVNGGDASESNETQSDGQVTFLVKYLGSTPVANPKCEQATADAVTAIINIAKASGKKLPRVALSVSQRGIEMTNPSTGEQIMEVSIYRIPYCSADAAHDHVFAFIATNSNETNECHAILCGKRKMAHAVTLTVAHNFNAAFQAWQSRETALHPLKAFKNGDAPGQQKADQAQQTPQQKSDQMSLDVNTGGFRGSARSLLIDFSSELPPKRCGAETFAHTTWVSFEDDQMDQENGNHLNLWADNNRLCL